MDPTWQLMLENPIYCLERNEQRTDSSRPTINNLIGKIMIKTKILQHQSEKETKLPILNLKEPKMNTKPQMPRLIKLCQLTEFIVLKIIITKLTQDIGFPNTLITIRLFILINSKVERLVKNKLRKTKYKSMKVLVNYELLILRMIQLPINFKVLKKLIT